MILDWILIVGGLAFLVAGAEALVRGASGIALKARVSPAVVGLTVVAAGTSMPELVVSVQAALEGSPALAVGNVVGSNIFNIGAIVGIAALVRPLQIVGNTVRLEWPVMMLAAFQLHLLARDGTVDRLEGGFLLAAMVAFTSYSVWLSRRATVPREQEEFAEVAEATQERAGGGSWLRNLLAVAVGIAFLGGGSTALVHGAVSVASALGMSQAAIGLTIVAAGTSSPELVTSIMAVRRGQDDVAIANVVGSNIFNVLAIAGTTSLIHPLPVPTEILERDAWWMLGLSLLLFPLMKSGMRINRLEGAFLVAVFVVYLTLLLMAQ